ncbi:MAG: hypothetical protein H7Z43_00995 [Clostridia bacterium]|nr:hypothetical protein [Deltaproteobacteria bacterium]
MAAFNGKAFLLGIQHLDAASRRLFDGHGKSMDGRLRLIEQISDDAMVRLASAELEWDDGLDRTR